MAELTEQELVDTWPPCERPRVILIRVTAPELPIMNHYRVQITSAHRRPAMITTCLATCRERPCVRLVIYTTSRHYAHGWQITDQL